MAEKARASLPAAAALPELLAAFSRGRNILFSAPPGAGKSTIVPYELLRSPQFAGRKILLAQPRRIAAVAIAHRIAELLGETVGHTVGYQVRHERRLGPSGRCILISAVPCSDWTECPTKERGVG